MHLIKVPVYILEGPDGSGKTTTGIKLAKRLSGTYLHNNQYAKLTKSVELYNLYSSQLYCAEDLCGLTLNTAIPLIIDRSWISELIYGQVYRDKSRMNEAHAKDMCHLAYRLEATIINFRPPWEVVQQNFLADGREELLANVEQLKKVYDLYESSKLPCSAFSTIEYDYTTQSLESLIRCLSDK